MSRGRAAQGGAGAVDYCSRQGREEGESGAEGGEAAEGACSPPAPLPHLTAASHSGSTAGCCAWWLCCRLHPEGVQPAVRQGRRQAGGQAEGDRHQAPVVRATSSSAPRSQPASPVHLPIIFHQAGARALHLSAAEPLPPFTVFWWCCCPRHVSWYACRGTANLFSHWRYANGASTNPDAHVFAYAAAQVKKAMEVSCRAPVALPRPLAATPADAATPRPCPTAVVPNPAAQHHFTLSTCLRACGVCLRACVCVRR